jgi:hypothetical protein
MLHQGALTPQYRQWLDRLGPVVEQARNQLRSRDPDDVARCSGCERDRRGDFRLDLMARPYVVSVGGFIVRPADQTTPASPFTTSLILTYLGMADGAPLAAGWIGFRELPAGLFYAQAFQGYSGGRLVRHLVGGLEAFRRSAGRFGGRSLAVGDAAYTFGVLPRIPLAVVYWEGDDEFPSQAQVLFDRNASHYMTTDGLAVLGSHLVDRLLDSGSPCAGG